MLRGFSIKLYFAHGITFEIHEVSQNDAQEFVFWAEAIDSSSSNIHVYQTGNTVKRFNRDFLCAMEITDTGRPLRGEE